MNYESGGDLRDYLSSSAADLSSYSWGRLEAFLCIVIENGFYLCVGSSELVLAEFDELLGLF